MTNASNDRLISVKRELVNGPTVSYAELGRRFGFSRGRISQIAISLGINAEARGYGRRYWLRQLRAGRHRTRRGPIPCPKCGSEFATRCGTTPAGNQKYRCPTKHVFIADRSKVKRSSEYYSKIASLPRPSRLGKFKEATSDYPYFTADETTQYINRRVPMWIAPDIRADVCQDILCDVLAGVSLSQVDKAYYRCKLKTYMRYRNSERSLHEPVGDTTLGELLGVL